MSVPDGTAPSGSSLRRRLWMALGYVAVGLGIAGTVLPLLPTTPFLLLAAGAFAKGSPALRDRLYSDPRFGPLLRNWHTEGAVPRRAKIAALTGLTVSWVILYLTMDRPFVVGIAGFCMALVALYIVTRPSPSGAPSVSTAETAAPAALQNEA